MKVSTSSTNPRRITLSAASERPTETALVLGHDRSAVSQTALSVAVDLTCRLSACLHVVHGVNLADYSIDPDIESFEQEACEAIAAERQQVEDALADSGASWFYHAWRGDPAGLIAQVADEVSAFMIVVGSRGSGPTALVSRLLQPSLSRELIVHQERPVLVVPAPNAGQKHNDSSQP